MLWGWDDFLFVPNLHIRVANKMNASRCWKDFAPTRNSPPGEVSRKCESDSGKQQKRKKKKDNPHKEKEKKKKKKNEQQQERRTSTSRRIWRDPQP